MSFLNRGLAFPILGFGLLNKEKDLSNFENAPIKHQKSVKFFKLIILNFEVNINKNYFY